MASTFFDDIDAFYDDNPLRRPSREVDCGVNWRDGNGSGQRVSWVQATGELYTVNRAGRIELLGVLSAPADDPYAYREIVDPIVDAADSSLEQLRAAL